MAEVGGVAAEQLVGAFAGQNHLDVLARRLRQKPRGQDGWIAERFRQRARHDLERTAERLVVGHHHVMDRPDLVRDRFGVIAFVVARLRETHRVGVNALVRNRPRGCRHEERRVEPPAREDAERHIGHQLALDRAEQQLPKLVGVVERQR